MLEEAPLPAALEPTGADGPHLLLLSARDEAALEQATKNLADYLDGTPADLGDTAFTLQRGRRSFALRRCVVAQGPAEAAALLRRPTASPVHTRHCQSDRPDVVFLFPGQGSQYAGMGRELYQRDQTFRIWFDRCADMLAPQLKCDLRQVIFDDGTETLDQTRFAQPALFALSYALAKVWLSWGVTPQIVGHTRRRIRRRMPGRRFHLGRWAPPRHIPGGNDASATRGRHVVAAGIRGAGAGLARFFVRAGGSQRAVALRGVRSA